MLTPPEIARSLLAAGESKARLPFGKMLLLAILAGAYIALFFPILLFVLCGYEHCIANLYYLPAGAFAAAEYGMETTLTLAGCLENLAAVTLGNLVSGAALGVGHRFAYLKE